MRQSAAIMWSLMWGVLYAAPLSAAQLEGEVAWTTPLTLSTSLDSTVVQTPARAGQQLKKGELLLKLEDEVAKARLAQARAELTHQKLLLAEAKSELQRSEELYDRTLLSDHDLVVARIAHAAADSSYRRAQTSLLVAQRELALTRIVAPFDAIVLQRHVQQGETVNGRFKAVPLYSVVEAKRQRVIVAVSVPQASGLSVGDKMTIGVGERRFSGVIDSMMRGSAKGGDPIRIELLFSPGSPLAPGSRVQVQLP